MKKIIVRNTTAALGVLMLAVFAWPSVVRAGVNDAPKKVREGIEHYEAGRFDQAATAFNAARQKRPDDARVTFDVACAKAAAGAADEATKLFQQAAVTPDAELAARCHYNLGRLATDRAKAALGEKPEAAEPEARDKARKAVAAAIGHWRDCLAMQPERADARYNMELAQLWLNHMDEAWKQADRQKRMATMKLPEMLQWIETHQQDLRDTTGELEGRHPNPLQRLAVHETAGNQRDLSEEIDPLKQKIAQEINQPQPAQASPLGQPGAAGAPGLGNSSAGTCATPGGCGATDSGLAAMSPQEREHAIKLLSGLADRAGESMRTAAEHLAEQSPADARANQSEAIEQVDQINTVITPYPTLVHRAVDRQKQLVGEPTTPPADDEKTTKSEEAKPDPAEAAWRQRFVERWTPILVAKAKQGLKNMPPPEPSPEKKDEPAAQPGATGVPPAPSRVGTAHQDRQPADKPNEKPDPQEAARRQRENLRKSMELAVKLGPDVQRLVARAAADLDAARTADALPKQKEAMALLEKIAEPLKEPNQNQQNQKKDNKDQNQKNKNQDQQNKQDKKQDQDKKNQPKQDKKNADQKNQPQPKDQQPQAAKRQPRNLSKQQAEALIEQVRQRDREKEKARKALIEATSRPPKPEKDW